MILIFQIADTKTTSILGEADSVPRDQALRTITFITSPSPQEGPTPAINKVKHGFGDQRTRHMNKPLTLKPTFPLQFRMHTCALTTSSCTPNMSYASHRNKEFKTTSQKQMRKLEICTYGKWILPKCHQICGFRQVALMKRYTSTKMPFHDFNSHLIFFGQISDLKWQFCPYVDFTSSSYPLSLISPHLCE